MVSAIGLPVFCTSAATISSARASIASAMRYNASDRSDGVVCPHDLNACDAAFIAASTSAAPLRDASPYCCPVDGSIMALV